MSKLRKLKTKKLFYGKWPYKIATVCPGGSYIRAFGVDYCRIKAENNGFQGTPFKHVNNQKLVEFCIKYKKIPKDIFKVRFEGAHVNFFVENKTDFLKIVDIMKPFITLTSEPEDQEILETLQSDKKNVVVDNFPFGKYTSRVIFKTMPLSARENLNGL